MSAISNARWIGIAQVFKIVIQFVGLAVLARYIPPAEYGLMAMATVVTNLAMMLRDMGTAAAIIQKESLNEETKVTVFWFNVVLGLLLTLALLVFSKPIAIAYKKTELVEVLCCLAPIFLITSSAALHQALLERKSSFQTIARIELSAALASLAVAIIAAMNGAGVYSLVLQAITNACLSSCQLWFASEWRPNRKWHHDEFKGLFHFSGSLSAFNFLNFFGRNADGMIIGRFLGAAAIGNYSMAYKIMLFPLQSMTFVTSRALFPVMSRQQNSIEDMAALYLRAVSFVVFFTAPLMAGIFVLRAPFILYCFGSQWGQVSNILIWLAPVGFLQSIVSTTGTVFMARGRTDVLLKLGTLGTVLQVSAFIIGVRWGVIGVAICYFISNVLNAFPALIVTMRQLNSSITVLGKNLMASILNAGLMACGVYGLSIFTPNTLLGFAELIFAGVILYVVLAILFQQSNCKSLLRVLKPGIS